MTIATSPSHALIPSRTEAIAERVLADIRRRGLVTGDRYLTAEEARDQFGVGKNLINDALKLLADRDLLTRRQRSGTFVGPAFQIQQDVIKRDAAISVIHVLMPMGYYRANVIPGNVFVDELSQSVPGSSVQIHYIADKDLASYALDLIERLAESGSNREALVLLRSSREVQLAAQASGLPAVVFGSTYPDADRLSSIDPDQVEAGRLAATETIKRGHQQFALIMRNKWGRGDNLLMEGMSQVLGEAGIGIDQVRVLSTAESATMIEHDVADLLTSTPAPTALICRSRFHATAAAKGVRDRGLEPMKDVLVVCVEASTADENHADLAVVPSLGAEQQVQQIGQLLLKQATDPMYEAHCINVPVHIEEPGQSSTDHHSTTRRSRV